MTSPYGGYNFSNLWFNSFQVTNILVQSLETTSLTELNIAWRKAGVSEEIAFEAGQKYAIKDQSTNMVGLWHFQFLHRWLGVCFYQDTYNTVTWHVLRASRVTLCYVVPVITYLTLFQVPPVPYATISIYVTGIYEQKYQREQPSLIRHNGSVNSV